MKKFTLFISILFASLLTWANNVQPNTVQFKRQDSDHIKQIFEAWNKDKGDYLYESMAALTMHQQQPERPNGVNKTPFELLQSMDEQRIDRLDRIATQELENEKKSKRGNRDSYYWEEWRTLLRNSKCDMNRASSGGDPHNKTFDGEKYDFQNAGDYLLSASKDNTFMVQVQQYRLDESISLIGGVSMNINGDILEFKSVEQANEKRTISINGEEVQNEKTDLVLPQGGIVNYKNKKYVVKWPTGEQMQVSTRKFKGKELYDLYIFVPECKQGYDGLLGNNDGIKNDLIRNPSDIDHAIVPDRTNHDQEELFGEKRHAPEVIDRTRKTAFYIAHDFGDTYQLNSKTSLFTNQMTDIPDEIRYPSKPLNLSGLTDDQIQEGLKRAKKAGVPKDELYGAVYDYGYVGLEPVAYKDEYEKPNRSEKYNEPKLDKEGERLKNAQEQPRTQPVRVYPRVFMGTGVYYPNRYRNPRTSRPHPNRPTSRTSNSGGRVPTTSTSNSGTRTPDSGGTPPTTSNTGGRTPDTGGTPPTRTSQPSTRAPKSVQTSAPTSRTSNTRTQTSSTRSTKTTTTSRPISRSSRSTTRTTRSIPTRSGGHR